MPEENLYRAPVLERDEVGEARSPEDLVMVTPGGSSLEIGPRRAFTAQWIRTIYLRPLFASAPIILVLVFAIGPSDFAVKSSISLLVFLACSEINLRRIRLPPIGGEAPHALARDRGGCVVDLTFSPRLAVKGWEAMDTADDIGVLWVETDRLHFEGDRCRMQLDRSDVRRIGRKRDTLSMLSGYGLDALVEFEREINGQGSVHFSPRELRKKFRAHRRGRALRHLIESWYGAADE